MATGVLAQVSKLHYTLTSGVSGVRRELTAVRKELAVSNDNVRTITEKTGDIAVASDAMGVSVVMMRQAVSKLGVDMAERFTAASALAEGASGAPRAATGTRDAAARSAPTTAGSAGEAQAQTEEEMEIQDARWVPKLKVCHVAQGECCVCELQRLLARCTWALVLHFEFLFGPHLVLCLTCAVMPCPSCYFLVSFSILCCPYSAP